MAYLIHGLICHIMKPKIKRPVFRKLRVMGVKIIPSMNFESFSLFLVSLLSILNTLSATSGTRSEPCQTSKVEFAAKIVGSFQPCLLSPNPPS